MSKKIIVHRAMLKEQGKHECNRKIKTAIREFETKSIEVIVGRTCVENMVGMNFSNSCTGIMRCVCTNGVDDDRVFKILFERRSA